MTHRYSATRLCTISASARTVESRKFYEGIQGYMFREIRDEVTRLV